MKRCLSSLFSLVLIWVAASSCLAQAPAALTITYLYDNTALKEGTRPHWGFSCLVQTAGNEVLFDTGATANTLRWNVSALGTDLSRLKALVISHEHADHIGGLSALGDRPGVPVFLPATFSEINREMFTRQGFRPVLVSDRETVCPGLSTSAALWGSIPEQALVADTPQGLVVLVGCAHPGILPMLKRIAEAHQRPIHMVVGGFHLLETPAEEIKRIVQEFKRMGIAVAGPTHCTGDRAIELFREAYGSRFISGGVGTLIRVP